MKAPKTPSRRAKSEMVKFDNKTPKRQTKVSEAVCKEDDRCKTPRRSTRLNNIISQSAKRDTKPKSITKRRYSVHEFVANLPEQPHNRTDDAKFRKTLFSVNEEKDEETEEKPMQNTTELSQETICSDVSTTDFPGFDLSANIESKRSTRKRSTASSESNKTIDDAMPAENSQLKFAEELSQTITRQSLTEIDQQQVNVKNDKIRRKTFSIDREDEVEVDLTMNNSTKDETENAVEVHQIDQVLPETESDPIPEMEIPVGIEQTSDLSPIRESLENSKEDKESESEPIPETEITVGIEHSDLSPIRENLEDSKDEKEVRTEQQTGKSKDETYELTNVSSMETENLENIPPEETSETRKKLSRPSIIDLTDSPASAISPAIPVTPVTEADFDLIEIPDSPDIDPTALAIYSPIRFHRTPVTKKAIVTNDSASLRNFILKKTPKRLQQTPFKFGKLLNSKDEEDIPEPSSVNSLGKKFGMAEKPLKRLMPPSETGTPMKGIRKRSFSVTEKKSVTFKNELEEYKKIEEPSQSQSSDLKAGTAERKREIFFFLSFFIFIF